MKVLVVLLALACTALYVQAQNVICGKGTTTKTVTVEDKKSYTFKTQKGKKYKGNTDCTADYVMGDTCAKMSFSCTKFNTNNKDKKKCAKGDKVTVTANGKSKAYCKTKKPKVTSTGDITVVFTSDKKKSGTGAVCKVKCTEAATETTTSGGGTGTTGQYPLLTLPPLPDIISNDLMMQMFLLAAESKTDCSENSTVTRPPHEFSPGEQFCIATCAAPNGDYYYDYCVEKGSIDFFTFSNETQSLVPTTASTGSGADGPLGNRNRKTNKQTTETVTTTETGTTTGKETTTETETTSSSSSTATTAGTTVTTTSTGSGAAGPSGNQNRKISTHYTMTTTTSTTTAHYFTSTTPTFLNPSVIPIYNLWFCPRRISTIKSTPVCCLHPRVYYNRKAQPFCCETLYLC